MSQRQPPPPVPPPSTSTAAGLAEWAIAMATHALRTNDMPPPPGMASLWNVALITAREAREATDGKGHAEGTDWFNAASRLAAAILAIEGVAFNLPEHHAMWGMLTHYAAGKDTFSGFDEVGELVLELFRAGED